MKKDSKRATLTKEALRANREVLFQDISALLVRHGHEGLRVRSIGVESDTGDCGGRPKVPLKVKGPNGEFITIWVCPS